MYWWTLCQSWSYSKKKIRRIQSLSLSLPPPSLAHLSASFVCRSHQMLFSLLEHKFLLLILFLGSLLMFVANRRAKVLKVSWKNGILGETPRPYSPALPHFPPTSEAEVQLMVSPYLIVSLAQWECVRSSHFPLCLLTLSPLLPLTGPWTGL